MTSIQNLIHKTTAVLIGEDRPANLLHGLHRSLLPDIPRSSSFRDRMADGLFVLLTIFSRSAFIVGAVLGTREHGFTGFCFGLLAGWGLGFWVRRSLGLRKGDLTEAFYIRMVNRGDGAPPRLLEALIETLRGQRLDVRQCQRIGNAYLNASRRLQSYDSPAERAQILDELDRRVFEAARG
ncbi:MAG: hypothetical protein KGJ60_09360 [Verrucomicrobiota bacterium]|nr:hypothetical protein [Verrucomicrobiota bacterium]